MLFLFRIGSRQVLIVISFVVSMLFSGCSHRSESELAVFKTLDESLSNSNLTISRSSDMVYASLKEKLTDPATSYKAEIWEAKAAIIKKISLDIFKYIEGLKENLKKEAGLKIHEGREIFSEGDDSAVEMLFDKKNKGKELFEKFHQYNKSIMAIDKDLDSTFRHSSELRYHFFDSSTNDYKLFVKSYFKNVPVVGALAFLNKIQNNIKITENRMMIFCNNKCATMVLICTFTSAIVAQSSTILRAGELLEITAGVGSFSWRETKPEIFVNGKAVEIDETGVAVSKLKSSPKPGKHYIPVRVTYIDQDQKKQTIEKTVEYTVVAGLQKMK
jgi:gliding motility-associated protein GldM